MTGFMALENPRIQCFSSSWTLRALAMTLCHTGVSLSLAGCNPRDIRYSQKQTLQQQIILHGYRSDLVTHRWLLWILSGCWDLVVIVFWAYDWSVVTSWPLTMSAEWWTNVMVFGGPTILAGTNQTKIFLHLQSAKFCKIPRKWPKGPCAWFSPPGVRTDRLWWRVRLPHTWPGTQP